MQGQNQENKSQVGDKKQAFSLKGNEGLIDRLFTKLTITLEGLKDEAIEARDQAEVSKYEQAIQLHQKTIEIVAELKKIQTISKKSN